MGNRGLRHVRTSAASAHDTTAWREELKQKMPDGKRVIVDRACKGKGDDEKSKLAPPNPLDGEAVKQFKKEARARHEHFNSRLKSYHCLKDQFVHGVPKQNVCFRAVLVLLQCAIEDTSQHGEPLPSL